MCGICGFAGPGNHDDIQKMMDVLEHRGPDAFGQLHSSKHNVFLGHRRLSIIDIESGVQPLSTSDDRYVIVFNGEIYNHLDLRKELLKLGHKFITDHSDTEVILHGYSQWGKNVCERLNGMWAFVIYDRLKGILFCSRDRFGQKPFYYYHANGLFIFSSELTSLIAHPAIPRKVSRLSLKKYFAYGYIPAPLSLYQGVSKLHGGQNLIVDINSFAIECSTYFRYTIEPDESTPFPTLVEELREKLTAAVKRRLMSDVPLGVFLSGGVDSSAVAGIAASCSSSQIQTFSVGFNEASFDETQYSDQVSKQFSTLHSHQILSVEKVASLAAEAVSRIDEPMGDSSFLPTYMLSKMTASKVKVALGGDGADELFAGYDIFKILKLSKLYDKLMPEKIHDGLKLLFARMRVSHRRLSWDFKINRALRGLSHKQRHWLPVWLGTLDISEINDLFLDKNDPEEIYSEAVECWDSCKGMNIFDKAMTFYVKMYLQNDNLTKVDRASMLHSLEVRSPFLDIDLINLVRKIPWQFKYHNGQTKYILKKSLESLLSKDILYRKKKGFSVPIGKWFCDGSLKLNPNYPLLNNEMTTKYIEAHSCGIENHRSFLWNLFVLENCSHGINMK